MSFNYPNMGRNPMHNMMMNNLANGSSTGNNIITQIAAAMTATARAANLPPKPSSAVSTVGSIRAGPPHATFNNAPLDFKPVITAGGSSKPPYSHGDRGSHRDPKNHQLGPGPMDLENDNESNAASSYTNLRKFLAGSSTNREAIRVNPDEQPTAPVADNQAQIFLNSMIHQGFMMMQPAMMMDPAAMALHMQRFPMMPDITNPAEPSTSAAQSTVTANVPLKEVIHCKSCTLLPPSPTSPVPTIRDRPPGCRTVFVGGLPENITEDIIREIFDSCGEITTLRLSKKNFCHVRFVYEASVDAAIYLSGYRIRFGSKDPVTSGRLHVDYAQARDDQYEWECKQRQLQREQRHRERMERDKHRSVSPPPIVHYTENEALALSEYLKADDTFMNAMQTLIVWLERGDCSKKNANVFYSMIQSTNAHIRRLNTDKQQYDEELRKVREHYRKQMLIMTKQFTQIEKVFSAASHKKVWDHFTKAQRKNIDQWKKLSMEMRSVQIEDDEMEMSDDDRDYRSPSNKRCRYDNDTLKEENDSLRCQLETYKNEMTLVKCDIKSDTDFRDKQIKVLQETIRNMQSQLLENKTRERKDLNKIDHLEKKLKEANVKQLLLKTRIVEVSAMRSSNSSRSSECEEVIEISAPVVGQNDVIELKDDDEEDQRQYVPSATYNIDDSQGLDEPKDTLAATIIEDSHDSDEPKRKTDKMDDSHETDRPIATAASNKIEDSHELDKPKDVISQVKPASLDLDDAHIISLVSTFLVIHPIGAGSDYICSYLQKITNNTNLQSDRLNDILRKYSNLFKESVRETGTNVEPMWTFCGFAMNNDQKC